MIDLEPIRAELAEITPGPWVADDDSVVLQSKLHPKLIGSCDHYDDARFVAQTPTLIAELVAEIERLRKGLASHLNQTDDVCQDHGIPWPCPIAELVLDLGHDS